MWVNFVLDGSYFNFTKAVEKWYRLVRHVPLSIVPTFFSNIMVWIQFFGALDIVPCHTFSEHNYFLFWVDHYSCSFSVMEISLSFELPWITLMKFSSPRGLDDHISFTGKDLSGNCLFVPFFKFRLAPLRWS